MEELELKKKKLNGWVKLAIGLAFLVVLFVVLRVFGVLQWYHVDQNANAPSLRTGDQFLATNLNTPERYDLITYKRLRDGFEEVWVSRIMAFEGESVMLKNGGFYVNEQFMDGDLNLQHCYRCQTEEGEITAQFLNLEPYVDYYPNEYPQYFDSIDLYLTDEQAKDYPSLKRRVYYEPNDSIATFWGEAWDQNDFGPITVPENHCFVIGDNRDASFDSRYFGFIHVDKVYGVLF